MPLNKKTILSGFKTYTLPILSGFLMGTTYIPFPPWATAFYLVPLWIFWFKNANSPREIFWGGWITQFIFSMIGFHWVSHTVTEFGGFPWPVGIVILLLYCSTIHLYYPLSGLLWSWINKKVSSRWSLLFLPLSLSLAELFFPNLFFWHFGYSWLWAKLPGAHAAEWIGFYGLNLFILFINLFILIFILTKKKRALALAVLLFIIPNVTGYYLQKRFVEGTETLQALVVQANIGNNIKSHQQEGPQLHDFIINKFLQMTDLGLKAHPETQLILWPETAYPNFLTYGKRKNQYQKRLEYFVNAISVPLLAGAYRIDPSQTVYNSMMIIDKTGELNTHYDKTMLLAFGEYFPGSQLLPQLKTWFPMVSDFGRGPGPSILEAEALPRFGAQICYEALFDGFSAKLYHKGAEIIVNLTNDSWFGLGFEPYQHLYITMARAIEFRLPLIRSTNTGISTLITAGGDIKEFSPLHQEWTGLFTIPYKKNPPPTVYSYFAGHWHWMMLFITLALFAGGVYAKSRDN